MTYREWMEKHGPDAIDSRSKGGVFGCPSQVGSEAAGTRNLCASEGIPTDELCRRCWDQTIPESVLADLTAAEDTDGADSYTQAATDSSEKPTSVTRADILHEAERMVCGHRQQDYGSPEENFEMIAQLWGPYIRKRLGLEYSHSVNCITAEDVVNMMVLFKMARITSGTATRDSYVDMAGYAACGAEISLGG